MSRIQLEKKRGSRGTDRERERERERRERQRGRKGEGGGVGESRRHVNRYMFETHSVFILAFMQREVGEAMGRGMRSATIPEC